MISLKRYLERDTDKSLRFFVDAYRSALALMGESGRRVCPPVGQLLHRELASANEHLGKKQSISAIKSTHETVLKHIRQWAEQAEGYYRQKAGEVKELLLEMAGTAEHVGKRNRRYAGKFAKVNAKLLEIAELEDLSRIRRSLLASAAEMRSCIDQMTREDRETMAQLHASLSSYQVRLKQAEQLASRDALTGLFNRREVEARIQRRIAARNQFCVVVLDLNEFKQVNDRYGHIAGDELLRRIAAELKAASRVDDIIGRWGGDEFILVLDCPLLSAKMQVRRLRNWVFGVYDIEFGGDRIQVPASASIGMAEWMHGETLLQVLNRADTEMYQEKSRSGAPLTNLATVAVRN